MNDYFASLIEDTNHRDPYNEANGIRAVEIREGRSVVEAALLPEHRNIWGMPHGGLLFAMADVAAGIAADSLCQGMHIVTAGSSLHFLASNPDAKLLRAEGQVVKPGRRMIIVQTEIYDELGKHLLTGQFTMYNAQ